MVKAIEIQSAAVLEVENEDAHKYLTFLLPGKVFAVSIMKVKEIIEYGNVIDVPMMPKFINGAINLRSQVIPVVDLNVRLGSEKTEVTRRSCIVVVELDLDGDSKKVGLLVEAVSKVVDFNQSQIDEAPSFNGNIKTDYIEGMGKTEDGFIILLNIDNLLSMEDIDQFDKLSLGGMKEQENEGWDDPADIQSVAEQIAAQTHIESAPDDIAENDSSTDED